MRLFYASFLSSENVSFYESLVAGLMAEVPGALRPVPAKSQHLTLAFIGETSEQDVDKCVDVLAVVKRFGPISISLDPPRILSSRKWPRLICTDLLDGAEQVAALQKDLCAAFAKHFPDSDLRPKPPHVTLARFNRKADRHTGQRVVDALSRREDSQQARADDLSRVHLVKSTLTPTGPLYKSLSEAALRK